MTTNISKIYSAELDGIKAKLIEIETDLNVGLHSFNIVGLGDKAVSEAKERVGSAIKNTGAKPPTRENRKITVNLAPADIKKTGSQYDVAIAIGYLLATEQINKFDPSKMMFLGELALDGGVRKINGGLNFAMLAKDHGIKEVFLPTQNAKEASLIDGIKIIPVSSLADIVNHIAESKLIEPHKTTKFSPKDEYEVDISEVKGQQSAKRAAIIATAGGHNILMTGPPGSGKTMLAQAIRSILPPMELDEAIDISRVWSAAGLLEGNYMDQRPFRTPHQSASAASVIGGGANPRPGEISLAHRGILFLDELPEFRRDVLESLRQPLESGKITVTRVKNNLVFPANFMLIAAMNPCPCGFVGDKENECKCTAFEIFRYNKKISGPLLDRIDIQINVPRSKLEHLKNNDKSDSKQIKESVKRARKIQRERFKKMGLTISLNSEVSSKDCEACCNLTDKAEEFIKNIFDKSLLSARGYYRILKTARTIADLDESDTVEENHISEAFQMRLRETSTNN